MITLSLANDDLDKLMLYCIIFYTMCQINKKLRKRING